MASIEAASLAWRAESRASSLGRRASVMYLSTASIFWPVFSPKDSRGDSMSDEEDWMTLV